MNTFIKIMLVIMTSVMLTNCSTYKIKSDMTKNGVVNKTPKWYVDYDHETWKKYQEAATSVSPDMELAVKKSILLAKNKSYRVYVMVEISKKDVDAIIEEINKKKFAVKIDTKEIDKAAKEVLN